MQFVAAAGIVLLLWLASAELTGGRMSPAELVSFLLYAQLLTRPVAGLADVYGQTQTARGALARLLQALDEPPEPPAHVGATLPPVKGEIEFDGVTFAYPGRPPALDDVEPAHRRRRDRRHRRPQRRRQEHARAPADAAARAGGRADPDRRHRHRHRVARTACARQIGVVPQHVLLFNASVRDNIAYGRPEPTPAAIEAAARPPARTTSSSQLPQGYDTLIGDRGVRLSGGQQQRLALARALLKDPPILILDEATAMFDPQGEAEFLEGLPRRAAGPHGAADHASAGESGGGGSDRTSGGWAAACAIARTNDLNQVFAMSVRNAKQ